MQNDQKVIIAIFTPLPLVKIVEPALTYFPSVDPEWYIYDSLDEAISLYADMESASTAEATLFVEHYIYEQLLSQREFQSPTHFVSATGNNIYRSLYRLWSEGKVEHLSFERLPLQSMSKVLIDLDKMEPTIHMHSQQMGECELIRAHRHIIDEYDNAVVLTMRHSVASELRKDQYRCELIEPTEQDLMVSIERLFLNTASRQDWESQVVIGLLELIPQSVKSNATQVLHDEFTLFARELNSLALTLDNGLKLVLTTRGDFERVTRGYKELPFFKENSEGLQFNMGAGVGETSEVAYNNAKAALQQSKIAAGNVCYIAHDNKRIFGPVHMTKHLVYETEVTDPEVIEKAKNAGMSASYMLKLMAEIHRQNQVVFSAHDLSNLLGITLRSVHRHLTKWVDAKLVEITGEEKTSHRGRPRTLYSFEWLKDHSSL